MELVTRLQLKRASVVHEACKLDFSNARLFLDEVFDDYKYVVSLWEKERQYRQLDYGTDKFLGFIDLKEYIKELKWNLDFLRDNPEHYE